MVVVTRFVTLASGWGVATETDKEWAFLVGEEPSASQSGFRFLGELGPTPELLEW